MLDCNKRQKIVKRSSNETRFKCLNKSCGFYRQTVNEEICNECSLRSTEHEKPCKKKVFKPRETIEKEIDELKKEGLEIDETVDYPSLLVQISNYKDALIRWKKAGKPTRSDEEVQNIHKQCSKCDWYDSGKKRCKGCGCKVTTSGFAVFNKIKMATEHCPKGLW